MNFSVSIGGVLEIGFREVFALHFAKRKEWGRGREKRTSKNRRKRRNSVGMIEKDDENDF